MPIYEYKCPKCETEIEHLQRMTDKPPKCPECGHEPMTKLVSVTNFELKGGGWASDGYSG